MENPSNVRATTVVTVKPDQRNVLNVQPDSPQPTRLQQSNLSRELILASNDLDQASDVVTRITAKLREAIAPAMFLHVDGRRTTTTTIDHVEQSVFEQLPPGAAQQIRQWASSLVVAGETKVQHLSGAHSWTIVMVPVVVPNRPVEAFAAVMRRDQVDLDDVAAALQAGASHLRLWHAVQAERLAQVDAKNCSALLEVLSRLDHSESLADACRVLVNDIRELTQCDRVVLGLSKSGKVDCRVQAVSGLSDFDQRTELTQQFENVLNETVLRSRTTVLQGNDPHPIEGVMAHQELRDSMRCDTLISAPLSDGERGVIGAWVFLSGPEAPTDRWVEPFVRASDAVVGSRLAMIQRFQRNFVSRSVRSLFNTIGRKKVALFMVACLLVAATMLIPVNYKISCDCQLEPVSRRFVAAPYDGTLSESLVEAGEVVAAGQVLARMDARELRWELSGLEADFQSEKKKRDAAAARDEIASAQQSNLEMERLALKMKLIRHRLDNLEIASPVGGVVIAGDLEKSEGMPLSIGQAMFEIGPLDAMIVEVAIPERDIFHAEEGMEVEVRLDAAPHQVQQGTIVQISPRSELRDKESVFIAEVKLDNDDGVLRPGMKGSAKIISRHHALGWNLFHKAWESMAMMIGV